MTSGCAFTAADRRRTFWTTQPSVLSRTFGACSTVCDAPGLLLIDGCEPASTAPCCGSTPNMEPPCDVRSPCETPRTIATNDWLRGLAINMLFTDGRVEDTKCGVRPGGRGGHWSESFIDRGKPIGSRLRHIRAAATVRELTSLVKTLAEATLSKLVAYGVASSVTVSVTYAGANVFDMTAEIVAIDGRTTNVGVSATRSNNELRWV